MKKDDLIYVQHILDCIERIQLYVSNMDQDAFSDNLIVQDAVVRQLEIIGEATKRISKDFRQKYPDIPWIDMAGMRDVLIHDYIEVDFDIVWLTVNEQIPVLKKQINSLL